MSETHGLAHDGSLQVPILQSTQRPENSKSVAQRSRNWLLCVATPQDRALLAFGGIAAAANGIIFPAISWFLSDLFTAIFAQNPERDEKTEKAVATFCGLAGAAFVTATVVWIAFAEFGDRQMLRMRMMFFEYTLQQEVAWFDEIEPATLTTRLISDTYDFREGVAEKFSQLVVGVCSAVGGFAVAFTKSWKLTLVLCTAVPLVVFSLRNAVKRLEKFAAKQQESYASAGGIAESALSSIRTVAAFGGQEFESTRYAKQLLVAKRQGIFAAVINGLSMGSLLATMYCLYSLGFWFGRVLVVTDMQNGCYMNHILSGDLLDACFNGGTMLSTLFGVVGGMMGLGMLAQSFTALASARAAAGRIFEVLDRRPSMRVGEGYVPSDIQGHIVFQDVDFAYPMRKDTLALNSFSLEIEPGKSFALVGPSGSGKSTVIALIQRFYDVQAGRVMLDGVDIQTVQLSWLRAQMALVQQEPVLFAGTIRQNIAYGRSCSTEDEIHEAARMAKAHEFVSGFPLGYATKAGDRGMQLSGGQKQRIAIARAIIRSPAILLLDEATSALDTQSEQEVQAALDQLLQNRRRTTIVIAHRLSTVRTADQICVLQNGTLLQKGNHLELLSQVGSWYAQLSEMQQLTKQENHTDLVRQVSGQSSGSASPEGRVPMFTSDSPTNPTLGMIEQMELPEDNQPNEEEELRRPVPFRRLWWLNRNDGFALAVGVIATVAVASSRPLLGNVFADAANLFTKDLAIHIISEGMEAAETYVTEHANTFCLEFIGIAGALFVGYFAQVVAFRSTAESLTMQLRLNTFKAMLRQDMAWYDRQKPGVLAERLATEVPLIRAFTGEQLATTLQALCTMVVGLFLAFQASWKLTFALSVFLPILGIGVLVTIKSREAKHDEVAKDMSPIASEAFGNIRTVASLGLEQELCVKFSASIASMGRALRRQNVLRGFANGITGAVVYIVFGCVFGLAVILIDHGWMKAEQVLKVFFPLMYSVIGVITTQTWAADRAKAKDAVAKIFNTIDRFPSIDPSSSQGEVLALVEGRIEFDNVHFSYPSRSTVFVFEGFSISIQAQTTVAFVGPSGSGKSTVVALLQRFYDPQEGAVRLDGKDIISLRLSWLRSQMGLVQQEPVLFGGSIEDNIKYGRLDATDVDVHDAAESANACNFITGFPEGYDTEVGDRGVKLSGGQKQRIAIARAIIRNPAVLLLDEATSALDSENERVVQLALDELLRRKKRTTILIAHRLATVQGADKIVVLLDGIVKEEGSHAKLLAVKGGYYSQLVARSES